MKENEIATLALDSAFEIHRALGPGLLESAYQNILYRELRRKRLHVVKEKHLPVIFKDIQLDHGYRIDLLLNNEVVIEIKTVEAFKDVHQAQVLTYLKLGGYKLGYLINFHSKLLKDGIRRFIM